MSARFAEPTSDPRLRHPIHRTSRCSIVSSSCSSTSAAVRSLARTAAYRAAHGAARGRRVSHTQSVPGASTRTSHAPPLPDGGGACAATTASAEARARPRRAYRDERAAAERTSSASRARSAAREAAASLSWFGHFQKKCCNATDAPVPREASSLPTPAAPPPQELLRRRGAQRPRRPLRHGQRDERLRLQAPAADAGARARRGSAAPACRTAPTRSEAPQQVATRQVLQEQAGAPLRRAARELRHPWQQLQRPAWPA